MDLRQILEELDGNGITLDTVADGCYDEAKLNEAILGFGLMHMEMQDINLDTDLIPGKMLLDAKKKMRDAVGS